MRTFWDERAREDAVYFVDNRQPYGDPDLDRFFADGERDLDGMLDAVGVSIQSSDTVVEIGCGLGRLTRPMADRASRVLALDISSEMLDRAQELNRHLDNVDWLLGDGASLAGVQDGAADVCVSAVVLQHLPDPAVVLAYVREIGRVLDSEGVAAINFSNDPAIHRRRRGLAPTLRALVGRGPRGQSHPAWLGAAVELDDIRGAAAEGGLVVEQVVGEGTQYCVARFRKRAP